MIACTAIAAALLTGSVTTEKAQSKRCRPAIVFEGPWREQRNNP